MSTNVIEKSLYSQLIDIDRRLRVIELARNSASYTPKVAALYLTPQADSFFADSNNYIEGLLAVKASDDTLQVYLNSTWNEVSFV